MKSFNTNTICVVVVLTSMLFCGCSPVDAIAPVVKVGRLMANPQHLYRLNHKATKWTANYCHNNIRQNNGSLVILTHNVLAYAGHYPDSQIKSFKTNYVVCQQAIEYYKNLNPNLIFLQEAPERPFVDDIANKLSMQSKHFGSGWAGNQQFPYGFPGAVLSKERPLATFDYIAQASNQIPDGLFNRHWGQTQWLLPYGDTLYVFQTHLCANYDGNFNEPTRLKELALLKKELDKLPPHAPVLLLGDMNFTPESAPHNEVLNWGFTNPCPQAGGTVPIPNPTHKIDHIFARLPEPYTLTCQVLAAVPIVGQGGYLTDHVAVMATLQW